MVDIEVEALHKEDNRVTHMVKCVQQGLTDLSKVEFKLPPGLYGRNLIVSVGNWFSVSLDMFDIECKIPFDDDTEANEAEITIYNLSDSSIGSLGYHDPITVTAGYKSDSNGVIFQGVIWHVKTKWEGIDKVTKIYASDNKDLYERDMVSKAYAAETKASTILKDLVDQLGLPIATFTTTRDTTYSEEQTIEGGIMAKIKEFAGICGTVAYINKQSVYVQPLDYAESDWLDVSTQTGLISDVEVTTEETKNGEYNDSRTVYKFKTLLNHRIVPSSCINLQSREASGQFRVFKGEHVCDSSNFYTQVSCY